MQYVLVKYCREILCSVFCILQTVERAEVLSPFFPSFFCLYFIFQMQENANELQYPEATEAQTCSSPMGGAVMHTCIFTILWMS